MTTTALRPSPALASRGARHLTLWFGGYALAVVAAAGLGAYQALHPAKVGVTVALATGLLTSSYVLAPSVRAFAERLGPYGLAWLHV